MIYIDPSEASETSALPPDVIEHAFTLPGLEHYTGADILVSVLDARIEAMDDLLPSQLALRNHCQHGLLIQRKTGLDLTHSVGPRLNHSLARMIPWTTHTSQRVLLFIGTLSCHDTGLATIGNSVTEKDYWPVRAALSKWQDRGGVVETVPEPDLVWPWLQMKERHLREYQGQPVKEVWSHTLQELREIDDERATLATFPGIGVKRATDLWEALPTKTLCQALVWLTDGYATEVSGIGKTTVAKAREWLGLANGEHLTIRWEESL